MIHKLHRILKENNYFSSHFMVGLAVMSLIYLTPLKHLNFIEPTFDDITPTQFHAEYTKNPDAYIFIDVRDIFSYNTLHAVGAISMPLHTLYDQRRVLPRHGKTIVLICTGGRASGVGFMYLQHYGFYNILRVKGGIEEWVNEEQPTESTIISSTITSQGTK